MVDDQTSRLLRRATEIARRLYGRTATVLTGTTAGTEGKGADFLAVVHHFDAADAPKTFGDTPACALLRVIEELVVRERLAQDRRAQEAAA